MKTDPNDSAYPIVDRNGYTAGMSKRELFAAMAMQGLCANSKLTSNHAEKLADYALDQADALIAALNEESK